MSKETNSVPYRCKQLIVIILSLLIICVWYYYTNFINSMSLGRWLKILIKEELLENNPSGNFFITFVASTD